MSLPVDDTLVLAEVFGPTVQGEGPSLGRVASFVRTGGCNLTCRWCDSAFTWDAKRFDLREELSRVPVADVLSQLAEQHAPLVVITGGEPLLHQQQEGWRILLNGIRAQGRRIEVETNGTITPDRFTVGMVDGFNVSPKLSHAGMTQEKRIRPEVLRAFDENGRAIFKWVCRTAEHVDTVARLTSDLEIHHSKVWIMPEGCSVEVLDTVTANIVPRALHHRFNFTPRLHVALWGDERGH